MSAKENDLLRIQNLITLPLLTKQFCPFQKSVHLYNSPSFQLSIRSILQDQIMFRPISRNTETTMCQGVSNQIE